jgi:signal transduction histidine kinase/ActR/RegA family two-component response regulator
MATLDHASLHRANLVVWKGSVRGALSSFVLTVPIVGASSASPWLWSWPLLMGALVLVRVVASRRFFSLPEPVQLEQAVRWRRRAILASTLTGLCWGPGVIVAAASDSMARMLVVMAIAGMIPGAAMSLAAIPGAFLGLVIPLWAISCLSLLLNARSRTEQGFSLLSVVMLPLLFKASRAMFAEFERVTALTVEQARLMKELEAARDAALTAAGARSEFLAVMSHELRTPLNGVVGLTELLLQTTLDDEQHHLAHDARESAQVLLSLISGVLDLSKIDAGHLDLEPTDFALRDEVGQLRSLFALGAQDKGLAFQVEVDDALPGLVRGDWNRLRQVLVNLLGNALKFTDRGHVSCRLRAGATVGSVRFEVEDSGIGLSAEQRGRVFEPFTQADASISRRFGGTGLGLTISKRLVELMGGQLELESREGQGSCFRFEVWLPAARRPSAPTPVPVISVGLAGRRVLVCDDNEVNLRVASGLLARAGCTVELTRNGAEALRALEGGHFDVVLMDLQMPVMDGYEALRRARAVGATVLDAEVPFVAVTASASQEDEERCRAVGFDAWLTKPIDPARLRSTLEQLLRRDAGSR